MPYRRLPNTDQARLRAIRTAIEAAESASTGDSLLSQKQLLEAKMFSPIFEQTIKQYSDARTQQAILGRQADVAAKQARIYLSHFIQVFNMCIARGEIKTETSKMLGLQLQGETVPALDTLPQLIEWGNTIISGEEKRMAMGSGNRIYNPSIAVVKVKMQQFTEQYHKHQDLMQTIQKLHTKVEEIRPKADALILELWNTIERNLGSIDTEAKREVAIRYGLVYAYRPSERLNNI